MPKGMVAVTLPYQIPVKKTKKPELKRQKELIENH